MGPFRFSLQRVLEWRELQLRLAEERVAELQRRLSALQARENEIRALQVKSELDLRAASAISGLELQARAPFHRSLKKRLELLHQQCRRIEAEIAVQRNALLKIRRDCRVIEILKEKKRKQWVYLQDREIEQVAAETYLAAWISNTSPNT